MCGIAGLIGVAPGRAAPAAGRMRAALAHRGPDAHGLEALPDPSGAAPPAYLVHTRLAILDLSPAGRQPMPDPAGTGRWLAFNGEVYNFRVLLAELESAGVRPATGTDTEVVLHAHRVWGPTAVDRLRGMFAYALADPAARRVTFARDRLGIKPLYLARVPGGGLAFASEVRALLAAGPDLVPPRLHRPAVEAFLAQGAVFGLDSHVAGVRLLPPGETLAVDWRGETIESRRFWAPAYPRQGDPAPDRATAVERLGTIAREAVGQHLVADVPVGVFLSSGVDSTAVAALATGAAARVRTLSIGFDRPEFDETAQAETFAEQLGTEHRTVRIAEADVRADFDRVLAAVDQPTVDGFNTYYVSRAARQAGLTVALSGLGGDELFGGYRTFRDVPRAVRALRLAGPVRWARPAVSLAARRLRSRALLKVAEALGRPAGPVDLYLLRREVFRPADRRALWALPAGADAANGMPPEELSRWAAGTAGLDPENRVSYLELTGYMRHMLLRDSDVFSMAHGLELRVPLLDHEFVDAATALPGAWKRPGPVPKPLLVAAAGPRLPAAVTALPKRGFTFPWAEWFRAGLAATAAERLTDRAVWARLGFDPAAPARLWDLFRRGDPTVGGVHVLGLVVLADLAARQGLSASQ